MVFEKDLSKIVAGEDETYNLNFKVNGDDKDVSDYTFEMRIIQKNGRNVTVSGDDVDDTAADQGEVIFDLSSEESAKLKEGQHEYIFMAKDSDGNNRAVVTGDLPVEVV